MEIKEVITYGGIGLGVAESTIAIIRDIGTRKKLKKLADEVSQHNSEVSQQLAYIASCVTPPAPPFPQQPQPQQQ